MLFFLSQNNLSQFSIPALAVSRKRSSLIVAQKPKKLLEPMREIKPVKRSFQPTDSPGIPNCSNLLKYLSPVQNRAEILAA